MAAKVKVMVQSLARLGDPSVNNPEFDAKSMRTYRNTLGASLSKLIAKSSVRGVLDAVISKLIPVEKLFIGLTGNVLMSRRKTVREKLTQLEKMFKDVGEIDLSQFSGSSEDIQLAGELLAMVQGGDRVAAASIWFPTVWYWAMNSNADAYITQRLMSELLIEYLSLDNLVRRGEVSIQDMNRLGEAGIARYIPFALAFHQYDPEVGKKYEELKIGWRAEPKENEISSTPLLNRKRLWWIQNDEFRQGAKKAIELILELRNRNTGTRKGDNFFLSEDFVRNNPDWCRGFLAEVRGLPAFTDVIAFAKEYRPSGFFDSFKGFDGNKFLHNVENMITMAEKLPEEYAEHGADAMFHLQAFIKAIYNLKDA